MTKGDEVCSRCEYLEQQLTDALATGSSELVDQIRAQLDEHRAEHSEALDEFADQY